MPSLDDDKPFLHTYTRKQALEDGYLYDFTEFSKEFGFRIPVAVTANLYATYIKPSQDLEEIGQSLEGRMADVLNPLTRMSDLH